VDRRTRPAKAPWAFAGALALFSFASVGCSKVEVDMDEPRPTFDVQIHVTSDPDQPLADAQVLSGTKVVGRTDAKGDVRVRFGGKEGDQVDLTVKCPADYESPSSPLTVSLRKLAAGSRPPLFEARCPPTMRTGVVGVRSDNGPNLPVTVLGRTVARTDASGAAIFTLRVKPSEQVAVTVGTTEKGAEMLRPQNPTLTFVAKDKDDFVVLDQPFTVQKAPRGRPKVDNRPKPL
jgi:hypothetical protein